MIEHDRVRPSLATLGVLAERLRRPLHALIDAPPPPAELAGVVLRRAESLLRQHRFTEALEAFTALRRRHVALMRATPRSAWTRFGVHEERGRLSFHELVDWIAAHDLNHLAQVARLRRSRKP